MAKLSIVAVSICLFGIIGVYAELHDDSHQNVKDLETLSAELEAEQLPANTEVTTLGQYLRQKRERPSEVRVEELRQIIERTQNALRPEADANRQQHQRQNAHQQPQQRQNAPRAPRALW